MSNKVRQWLLYALFALLAGLLVWWYFTLEWEEHEVDTGPSAEATRNPYLALQTFLDQKNQPNHFHRGFAGLAELQIDDQPLGRHDSLVLTHTYQAIPEHHLNALWQWVENGGNLIITAYNPYVGTTENVNDALLERLSLGLETEFEWDPSTIFGKPEEDHENEEHAQLEHADDADKEAPPLASRCRWQSQDSISLVNHQLSLTISVSKQARLFDYSEIDESSDSYATVPLQSYSVGEGTIHVFASEASLTNDAVACFDNGYVFWQLVKHHEKVWFVSNASSPSFWRELWQLSAVGCIALFAALAFWVWQQGVRFGPVYQIDRSHRRQFIDHIRASATFLLRNRNNEPLLKTLRDDIRQRMTIKHSNYTRLPANEQLAMLQQASSMSAADIQRAMFHPLPVPTNEFIGTVRRLQYLRNTL